ncbi:protein phosphatase CheZ [Polycladidibacter hongkongensis]|uniref:protein phosphatase CheZ n=1 Tax=Polycladidibacter hongkongensis TaxID=1647556 RepID=UPI00082AB9DC|nr:protein phosphatase CheZ [Pseudovibrio hongkongensis]
MKNNAKEAALTETEFNALEAALSETERGRAFLSEYISRNQAKDTKALLEAVSRLEASLDGKELPSELDTFRLYIYEMHEAIERTKSEIAKVKLSSEEAGSFATASNELDAIVSSTESATQTILEASEEIQEAAWNLRDSGASPALCEAIDAKATDILMACSFQDLTGQRIQKVVNALCYLEERINRMIGIWSISPDAFVAGATENAARIEEKEDLPRDTRPDAHLLNGPQMEGEGVNQSDIDALFDNDDDSFIIEDDLILEPAKVAPAEAEEALTEPQAQEPEAKPAVPDTIKTEASAEETASEPEVGIADTGSEEAVLDAPRSTSKQPAQLGAISQPDPAPQPEPDEQADASAEEDEEEERPSSGRTFKQIAKNSDPLEELSTGERLALFS